MLLRAVRAHLLPSLATLLLAFVVSAGAVGVVGASRVGQTPGAVAAMLALYGAVALAEQASRTVVDRSHDVALARLRGMTGMRLVLFAAGPLLAVSLVGSVLGSVAGTWLARRIAHGWAVPYSLGSREVAVAVTIVVGAWVTIALVSAAVIRRPLADALSVHPRRRGASWITTFLELLVVTGACLAVYEAHRSEQSWVPTIAPALVALAAGQLVMWVLSLTPKVGKRLGPELTSRRLRRDPDPGSVVRVLVAAAVLLAVTLTGGRAAAEWRNDAGRLRAGGPIVVPFVDGGLRAYAAAHDADPKGQWLMAAVAIDDLNPADRRVFVDTHRWDAVLGDFVGGTSAESATSRMSELGSSSGPALLRGTTIQADVGDIDTGASGGVALRYLSDKGFLQTARIHVDHTGTATGDLRSCAVGCAALQLTLSGDSFDVRSVSVGDTQLVGATAHAGGKAKPVLSVDGGTSVQPVLTTAGNRVSTSVEGVDGKDRSAHVIGTVGAVPFVGRVGTLLDLGQTLKGTVGTVASARAVVVARVDTPASILAELRQDGGGTSSTYAAV
ncbi:MAG TPA: FtsX-like permease family protein, partial [Nocardioides sp.]|nr:FtsX-like permease family protein [Nocardioides sp.]